MLADKVACFALLAHNCRDRLENNLLRIQWFNSYFKEMYIIVVESDSNDGTKELLREWQAKNDNVFVITKDFNKDNIVFKTNQIIIEKIILCRNLYLDFISGCAWKKKLDYLIAVDSDIHWFSKEGIISAIENAPDGWAALFANGRYYFDFIGRQILGRYYDLFAFVPSNAKHIPDNCCELTYREMALCADLLSPRELKKSKYMECRSAFGGIGIYKYKVLKDVRYVLQENNRSAKYALVCEHVPVNLSCLKHGKNYIAANLLVCYEKSLKSVISKFIPVKIKLKLIARLIQLQE
ncbi:MAG: glycosyltransferase family 2 protein [Treponematales bacterium]